jgi:hypothetical protein
MHRPDYRGSQLGCNALLPKTSALQANVVNPAVGRFRGNVFGSLASNV